MKSYNNYNLSYKISKLREQGLRYVAFPLRTNGAMMLGTSSANTITCLQMHCKIYTNRARKARINVYQMNEHNEACYMIFDMTTEKCVFKNF